MIPYTEDAYRLLHEGVRALARVEANGMRVDERYLSKTIDKIDRKVARRQAALADSDVMKVWRERFRDRTNFNSNQQLGKVLFEIMKFDCPERTASGQYKTDEKTLAKVDHPFIKDYFTIKKDQKAGQFLAGIRRQTCHGLLHPVFNLHIARTYRSSSDSPNFQNLPVRNERMKNLVRRAIIARKGWRLIEIDYKGIEVAVAACYHQDPNMIAYIEDKSKDMHRDMAMELYMLPAKEITKNIRHAAKNKFVFPQFYGSFWKDCSKDLWDAINKRSGYANTTESGKLVLKHLRRKGIKRLGDLDPKKGPAAGSFEEHVQRVERVFWEDWFPVYTEWKKEWYSDYLRQGWFQTKTGFICQGFMKRNEVINYPVQGAAFHCLLWSLIQFVNKELKKRGMRALVVGQIHDSMVSDVPDEEVDEFCALAEEIMVTRLKEHWDWINVPLEIEIEITPVGGSWVEKEVRK